MPDGTTVRVLSTLGTITGSGTTVSGVVTRTLTGTVSGTAGLSVESPTGTLLSIITGNSSIVLQPGPAAGTISLSPVPGSIMANGITTSNVTSGVIVDAYGNTVLDGTLITVATNFGTITTSDASGTDPGIQVATTGGVISFVVQSATMQVLRQLRLCQCLGAQAGSTQIAFVAGTPSAVNSTITATSPVYSDGVSASTVTITVRDSNMNLVSGATVSLSSSRGISDIITQPAGVTNASGPDYWDNSLYRHRRCIISATVNGAVTLNQTAGINFYNTKTGPNITVSPASNTSVTFDMVITIGITIIHSSRVRTCLTGGIRFPIYLNISTTATFSGNITVCITYNEATYGSREGLVKILHDEGGCPCRQDDLSNTATNTVCGV